MLEENQKPKGAFFYEGLSKECFASHPQSFREFVIEKQAIFEGDKLLSSGLSSGYNYATDADFPLGSDQPLIIYNNYIQRASHFGEVLAAMEEAGLINTDNFNFGAKATKVLGNWEDEEPVVSSIVRLGKVVEVSESVEGCLIFHPQDAIQAIKMVEFLDTKAKKTDEVTFIKGSWTVPDIRSTGKLEDILTLVGYKTVYANKLNIGNGNLITLKKSEKIIKDGWRNQKVLVNSALYEFID
jgi:hypothetical protein